MNLNIQRIFSKWWIATLGALASISILMWVVIDWRLITGGTADEKDVLMYFGLGLLPAFISVFTSISGRSWINLVIGLWYFFLVGLDHNGQPVLLLAALALSATPFLRLVFPSSAPTKEDTNQQTTHRQTNLRSIFNKKVAIGFIVTLTIMLAIFAIYKHIYDTTQYPVDLVKSQIESKFPAEWVKSEKGNSVILGWKAEAVKDKPNTYLVKYTIKDVGDKVSRERGRWWEVNTKEKIVREVTGNNVLEKKYGLELSKKEESNPTSDPDRWEPVEE